MSNKAIDLDSVVKAAASQVSSDLDGESVILDVETGTYFGLEGVGALVWNLIQQPRRVNDLCSEIVTEYDVTLKQCTADLLELLTELHDNGLIEVVDGALA